MSRRWAVALAWICLAGLVPIGCNAVLGIDAGTLGEGGAGGGGGGGGSAGAGGSDAARCPAIMAPDECEEGHVDTDTACCAEARSCQGGLCQDGSCTAFRIGLPTAEIIDMVVTGDRAYWSTGWGQQILSGRLDGSDQQALFEPLDEADSFVTQIATDGANIYFTDFGGGRIRSVPVGGETPPTVLSTVGGAPQAGFGRIKYADGFVYWAMYMSGGIYRAATDGSTPDAELVSPDFAVGVAVDSAHIYWSDTGAGRVRRLAISEIGSGAPSDVLTDIEEPGELVIDGERIYMLSGEALLSGIKDGTDANVIRHTTTQTTPWGMAVDDRFIYWSVFDEGELRRTRKDGEGPVTVMDGTQQELTGITQDCDTVYFATINGLYKVAK